MYASAGTLSGAQKGVREALLGFLDAMRAHGWRLPVRRTAVTVARVDTLASGRLVSLVGAGALLGRRTSRAKSAASRANGARGGRPRKSAA